MTNVRRRIITALILIFLITTFLSVNVYALNREDVQLDSSAENKMDTMGDEIFIWYTYFRACIVPLLICQYAWDGLQIASNGLLKKGEYKLDAIKTHMLYVTLAALVIVFFPRIIGWSMELFASHGWKPPATTY